MIGARGLIMRTMSMTPQQRRAQFSTGLPLATAREVAQALHIDPNQPGTARLAIALAEALNFAAKRAARTRRPSGRSHA